MAGRPTPVPNMAGPPRALAYRDQRAERAIEGRGYARAIEGRGYARAIQWWGFARAIQWRGYARATYRVALH
eukprot:3453442-Prymnesium_polylepis.2